MYNNKCRLALVQFLAQSKNKLQNCMETKMTNALQTSDAKARDATQDRDINAMDNVQECGTNVMDAVQDCESSLVDTAQDCHTEQDFEAKLEDTVQGCEAVQGCDNVQVCDSIQGCYTVQDCDTVQSCETEGCDSVQGCDAVQVCDSVQGCDAVEVCDSVQSCDSVQDHEAKPVDTVQHQETEAATSSSEKNQQDAAAITKCVRFKPEVDVSHFKRMLSLDRFPADRFHFPVGMAPKPFHRDTQPLPVTSPDVKRVPTHLSYPQRREMLQNCLKKLNSTPPRAKKLKQLIQEYDAVNESRMDCLRGCGCEGGVCNPNTCECAVNEIQCHAFMCGCSVYGCGNAHGRRTPDNARLQQHYDQTFYRQFVQTGKWPLRRWRKVPRPCPY